MKRIYRNVCGVLAFSIWAAPAAAQEPAWADALASDIQAHVERQAEIIARTAATVADRQAEAFARAASKAASTFAERHADMVAMAVEAQIRGGRAGRRAAEDARDAERRRRNDERRGPEYTEKVSKTLRLGRNGIFDLQNVGGSIVVAGGAGNDVRIEAVKRVRHPNESQARQLLKDIDILMTERNGNVEVRTEYPRRNWSGGVDYTVSVPRDADVVLRSVSGDIRVTSLNGELRAESVSGNVVASAVRRIRQAKSISGDVEIVDSEGDEVGGGTVSGDIVARNLKVRTADFQTVSGSLRMTDVESDRANAQSVSGEIDFVGRLARNGRYSFQSHSGNVRVAPTGSQGFTLEATTFSGDVRSDYPLTMQGVIAAGARPPSPPPPLDPNRLTPPPPPRPPRGPNRGIRGSFGDGSAMLSLQSFSGNITIDKR
jgi:DUF4097 and DUF4098 domain-containing protein YvlB